MEDLKGYVDFDKFLLKQNGKIIHQIWFGTIPTKKKAKKALEGLKKYKDSWINKNPTWTYVCWNLQLCKDLLNMYYMHHKELFDSYPYDIQRCDVIRYFILHRYGGLYADMDYYCNKSWDIVLENYDKSLYLVETPNKIGNEIHISNSLMYSRPGHIFWSKLFIELEQNKTAPIYYGRHLTIMFTTGPGILNRVFLKYKMSYKLHFYPHELFHPYGLNTEIISLKNENVYALHIGKGSWESNDSKIIIFLYQEYKILFFILFIVLTPNILSHIYLKNNIN
jgi:inositol phosphorylceramide mannosyltransferase catalytic subunit